MWEQLSALTAAAHAAADDDDAAPVAAAAAALDAHVGGTHVSPLCARGLTASRATSGCNSGRASSLTVVGRGSAVAKRADGLPGRSVLGSSAGSSGASAVTPALSELLRCSLPNVAAAGMCRRLVSCASGVSLLAAAIA